LHRILTTDLSNSYLCRKIVALLQVILFLLMLALDSHATSIVPKVIYLAILALMFTPVLLIEFIFVELLVSVPISILLLF
jgi:hypothetical protein